jgi:hypothetical protein
VEVDGGMGAGIQDPARIRNVALIGHPDAGATELYLKIRGEDQTPVEVIWMDLFL